MLPYTVGPSEGAVVVILGYVYVYTDKRRILCICLELTSVYHRIFSFCSVPLFQIHFTTFLRVSPCKRTALTSALDQCDP